MNAEHVLRPALITTVFPLLPRRFRPAFRVGLLVVVALLVLFVLLRWQPPLIGIGALGLLLLFVAYLRETAAFDDLSRVTLAITALLGVGAGIGWTFATDAIWARTYDDVLGTPMTPAEELVNLALVPILGVLVMFLPVVVVRLWRPGPLQPVNGFAIGAVAALSFTAAGILTRAAPEFANGLVLEDFPMDALVALAAIRGVAAPLTAIGIGGLVGATLWFRSRTDPRTRRHWFSLASPVPAVTIALLASLGQNAVDFAWISYGQIVALYAAITVLALVALRIILHATLSGERFDEPSARRPSALRPLLTVGGALVIVMATTIGLSAWLTPAPPNYACPPDCGRPPLGQPVTTNPRFTPSDGAFSVSYPGPGTAYDATLEDNGVYLELNAGDGGSLQLFGEPAANRTPRQIADALLQEAVPEATTDYEIPNAMVGYQPGYGVVTDVFKAGSAGDTARLRVLVMVAVKNDYALIAAASGPYREFTPDFGSGHPSGANFFLALDMGKYVNSFSWRGDPPR